MRTRHKRTREVSVFWGVPCDELGFSRFWIQFMKQSGYNPLIDGFAASEGTYLPKARNIIHKAYVEQGKADYLMMLDSDILFPPDVVGKLMRHGKPVVGGWYKDKVQKTPTVYDFINETDGVANFRHRNSQGTGIERVDALGAGCLLMSREVAEALGKEPYDMNGGGEDMKLSRKLMKMDIPLFVDWSVNCAHLGVFHL